MSKKLILLVVLGISVLSIIVIAVWGTLPESSSDTSVTSLTFENYELNDEQDKIINLSQIVSLEEPSYTLEYTYAPDDAVANIIAASSSDDVTVLVYPLRNEVLVNFETESSIGQNVTITITDQKTNTHDEITLIFKIPDVIIGD